MNDFVSVISIVVTEKSSILNDKHCKLVFFVPVAMNKAQIKSMIKSRFEGKIKMKKVSTLILKGKKRRFRGSIGKMSDRKKVILTTEGGKVSDFENL